MNERVKLGVTGHRPHKLDNEYDMKGPMSDNISYDMALDIFSKLKPIVGYTGLALGIDMIFADRCSQEGVPYIAVIPHKGQHLKWSDKQQKRYYRHLQEAQEIVIIDRAPGKMVYSYEEFCLLPCTPYEVWKYYKRNHYIVDRITDLVSVWDGSSGGTAECTRYAEKQNKIIHRINPNDIRARWERAKKEMDEQEQQDA